MRLERLTLKGLTRYDEASVDFAALGEGLIAIAGRNGEGKTSILEAPFAALHLEMPTRPGNLANVMHGKDASLDLSFSNGSPYRSLVAVDAIGKSTEAYLYNGDGSPVTDGKVRNYTAETERRFGSARLFLSACLSPQNHRGAFLELSKAERKDLLAEILDTSGLQSLSEAAREKAKATEKRLDSLRGELAAMKQELERLPAVDVATLQASLSAQEAKIKEAEASLEAARKAYADARAELAVAEEQAKGRAEKAKALEAAHRDLLDMQGRLEALTGERHRLTTRIAQARKEAKSEASRLQEYELHAEEVKTLESQLIHLQGDEARLSKEIEAAREELRQAEDVCRQADKVRNQIQAAKVQAELLTAVPCGGEGPYAGCRLISAARAAGDSLPELEAQLGLLAPLPDLEMKRGTVGILEKALRDNREMTKALDARLASERVLANRLPLAQAAGTRIADLERELADGEASLNSRAGEYSAALDKMGRQAVELKAELKGRAPVAIESMKTRLSGIAEEGRQKKDALATLQRALADLQADIGRAQEAEKRRRELALSLDMKAATEKDIVQDLGEWSILERALGRDGIQALEIDAAGPGLSDLTNELLTSCFGTRFEVQFVTQVPKADGKGSKEVFDVRVIDHERGREGAVDTLSGGEKTIASEAISLALAIYVGRHSGRKFETLFRDETAGQLDPDNASRYVSMLRRARQIGGFHQVIYIAQQPEVWQAADSVLWCEGGRVEVRA